MSLQTDLFALLASAFTDCVYPMVAPADTPTPYAVYSRISTLEITSLDTNGGAGNAYTTRLQIDVYAATYAAAQAKAGEVKAALKGWAVENIVDSEQDLYEPDTQLHRVLLDLTAWHY